MLCWWAWRRTAVRKRVIVNLGDKALTGILWAQRGPLLVLRDAQVLDVGMTPQAMDGEVVIERSTVEWVQVTG